MKVSKITLPIFLFGLIIFLLTSCAGITPVTPTPSPGTTDEDNTVINGTIKMPFTCCILKSEKQNTKNNSTKTESWAVIPGAVVELKSTENCKTLLDTTISDKSGNYTFKDVKPGIYIITAYCPSDRKYLTKDVVEKPLGQAVDAGTPDCNSTSLALVIEYLKDCYGEDYSCFNKKSSVYNMVKTIAGAVNQLDIDAIENNSNYDELVTMVSDAIYSCCGVISPGTTPSADSGGSSGTPSSVTKTTINAAVIPGIKAPVTGEVPVTTITDIAVKSAVSGSSKSNTQYTGTVSWKPEHDKFQGNTVYTATITLTPNDGYTLSGVPSNFFKVEGADSISNPANSGVVTAIFPKTESEKYTVTFPGPDNGSLSAKVDDVAINSGDDIEKGKSVVFTATPVQDWQIKDWYINGSSIGSTNETYTIDSLSSDINITVEFEEIPPATYEVTFKETNKLDGVSIQLYSDANRTQP
ncbi:MAG: carboxypeptidase-like regulatory domain-containing protein, partial [Atribacterota bacterium]|nr:carboxypeptidase-like regulatory domain-containing protein [Atribacterota bacterium]